METTLNRCSVLTTANRSTNTHDYLCSVGHVIDPSSLFYDAMCCCRVSVLEGGLPAWKAIGGELDTSAVDDQQLQAATEAARAAASGRTMKFKSTLKQDKV